MLHRPAGARPAPHAGRSTRRRRATSPARCARRRARWASSPRSSAGRRRRATSPPSSIPRSRPRPTPPAAPSCLSVLTDRPWFGGTVDDLARRARRVRAPGAAQGLHHRRGAGLRDARHRRRRHPADRRRAARRRAAARPARARASGSGSRCWSRPTTTPSSNARSRSARDIVGVNARNLGTFAEDLGVGERLARARAGRRGRDRRERDPLGRRRARAWPRPGSTRCWSARCSCEPPIRPRRCGVSPAVARSGSLTSSGRGRRLAGLAGRSRSDVVVVHRVQLLAPRPLAARGRRARARAGRGHSCQPAPSRAFIVDGRRRCRERASGAAVGRAASSTRKRSSAPERTPTQASTVATSPSPRRTRWPSSRRHEPECATRGTVPEDVLREPHAEVLRFVSSPHLLRRMTEVADELQSVRAVGRLERSVDHRHVDYLGVVHRVQVRGQRVEASATGSVGASQSSMVRSGSGARGRRGAGLCPHVD